MRRQRDGALDAQSNKLKRARLSRGVFMALLVGRPVRTTPRSNGKKNNEAACWANKFGDDAFRELFYGSPTFSLKQGPQQGATISANDVLPTPNRRLRRAVGQVLVFCESSTSSQLVGAVDHGLQGVQSLFSPPYRRTTAAGSARLRPVYKQLMPPATTRGRLREVVEIAAILGREDRMRQFGHVFEVRGSTSY